jgi:hypothetical protein
MKTIQSLDVAVTSKPFAAGSQMPFAMRVTRVRKRTRESLPLSEIIPLWFAISSPLIGLVLGFLGAWFVTWLTS